MNVNAEVAAGSKGKFDAATTAGSDTIAAKGGTKTVSIEYAFEERFQKPVIQQFSALGSVFSILSLILMSVLSTIMLLQLVNPGGGSIAGLGQVFHFLRPPPGYAHLATWVWLPFVFTIFGSALGGLFELMLLIQGHPFQQTRTKATTFIRNIRLLNLGPVAATILFFFCSVSIADPTLRLAALYFSGAFGFGLAFALFWGGAEKIVALSLLGIQVVQIIIVLAANLPPGGAIVVAFLVAQSLLQLTALVIGTATPLKSTAFHVISTLGGVMLYNAILGITESNANFSQQVAIVLPAGSAVLWGFILSCVCGLFFMSTVFPKTYCRWRTSVSYAVWSVLYFFLISANRFPNPYNLSQVYNNSKPEKTELKPYYIVHPQFLTETLSIPAAVKLERNVTIFKQLLAKTKKLFSFIALLDHNFPQAKVGIPLKNKPRMEVWSDGSEYWPNIFKKKIFGLTIPDGGVMEPTPEPVIAAYKQGQLLAYLTEFGVAATFAKRALGRGNGILVSDFRFLEVYETKADYESYGGMAYFRVNSEKQRLELISVVAPKSTIEIPVDPNDATFRRAESLVLASMYFQVISGKHLTEIHMTYNLVEVAMHNAFDVQGQWMHPFRTFLYLHFFSHELAEELTTEHLVQEGAVFNQIFATTHNSLISHLNDGYHRFQYGEDENFEERAAVMSMDKDAANIEGKILPNSCIAWELRYVKIWQRYSTALIDIIYNNDEAVQADSYLQDFYQGLLTVLINGLPSRYEQFQTKAGVARFASDTMHHMIIRHQVYGTTGIKAALDPRISKVQVPRDTGNYGIDEWRSLACVALATGKARFTLLLNDFTYLLDGVDEKYREPMQNVFEQLQEDLRILEAEWNTSEEDKVRNYNYFRTVPSALHTGPGY